MCGSNVRLLCVAHMYGSYRVSKLLALFSTMVDVFCSEPPLFGWRDHRRRCQEFRVRTQTDAAREDVRQWARRLKSKSLFKKNEKELKREREREAAGKERNLKRKQEVMFDLVVRVRTPDWISVAHCDLSSALSSSCGKWKTSCSITKYNGTIYIFLLENFSTRPSRKRLNKIIRFDSNRLRHLYCMSHTVSARPTLRHTVCVLANSFVHILPIGIRLGLLKFGLQIGMRCESVHNSLLIAQTLRLSVKFVG